MSGGCGVCMRLTLSLLLYVGRRCEKSESEGKDEVEGREHW